MTLYILGLGASGLSVLHYCQNQGLAAEVFDTRAAPPGLTALQHNYPEVPVHLGPLDALRLAKASEIIISPGLDPANPALDVARAAGIAISGDIELFARAARAPIIAITGTNAKGTVTTLVVEMLRAAGFRVEVGGNIGTPALDLLKQAVPDYYVLELSSFQLETTRSLRALAAVILNLSEDHLDRHGSMHAYLAAKQRIYQHATHKIINRDQPETWPPHVTEAALLYSFGRDVPENDQALGLRSVDGVVYLARGEELLLAIQNLHIKGLHNALNALAALALGFALGLKHDAMLSALQAFPGLPHRCQFIAETAGIAWYNDSKGTNVGASLAALEGLGEGLTGKIILIAGGVGKGQDFRPMLAPIQAYCRAVILLGQDAEALHALWQASAPCILVKNLAEAVQQARFMAEAGDVILLSPACASLDMFKNFEDRGEQFVKLVEAGCA